jgi:hypothetical protein
MTVKPLLLALPILHLLSAAAFAAEPCRDDAPEPNAVRLSGFDAAGDPLLGDGRALRLVGLAPRQDAAEDARFRAGLSTFIGQDLLIVLAGEKDRWGRWPARLFVAAAPAGAGQDVAALLQASGAALPMPETQAAACSSGAPAVQAQFTSAPQPLPVSAVDGHDLAAVKRQEGRYVMLEGRIASVGERSQRTYLNFSRRPAEAASIVMSRKLWRELQDAGWTAAGLGGKRLRAYGVLGGRNGLLLEVTSRAALELID